MSTQPLILKNGVITFPRSSTDISSVVDSLGVVDTSRNQTVGGNKYYSKSICVGLDSAISISQYSNTNIQTLNSIGGLNLYSGSFTGTTNLTSSFAFNNVDVEINSANTVAFNAQCLGQQLRIRNFGTGTINTLQGGRFTSLNSSTGNVTSQDGGYFLSRNDSTGIITTLNGGQFLSSVVLGTVTTANAGVFTVSTSANSTTTTVRGISVNASSSNTTPATDCVGIDIANITGTATNKYAIRTGTGQVSFGENLIVTGNITSNGLVLGSASNTLVGSIWRNSNNLEYKDSSAITRIIISSTDGIVPVVSGGTGSSTQNFVDLTTTQSVGGIKTFNEIRTFGSNNAFRMINSANTAAMFYRSDNSNMFLLLTNVGDPGGTFNSLRPFSIVFSTGALTLGTQVLMTGLPTSSTGLAAGSLWRNGNVVNIV